MQLCIQLSRLATIHVIHMWKNANRAGHNTHMMHMMQPTQADFLNTSKEKKLSKTFQTTWKHNQVNAKQCFVALQFQVYSPC